MVPVLQADQTEWNVDTVSRPFVAQQFYNLNPLLEVEILLRSDYVDVLIEIIGFFLYTAAAISLVI